MPSQSGEQEKALVSHRIVVDGISTHYYEQGSGDPVVFLHGAGGNAGYWLRIVSEVAQQHRAISVNLPGFGQTERLSGEDPEEVAGFLWKFFDAIGLVRPILVGHSYGGLLSLMVALSRPADIRGVVLVGSGGLGRFINPGLLGVAVTSGPSPFPWIARSPLGPELLVASLAAVGAFRPWRLPPWWWWFELETASSFRGLETTLRTLRASSTYRGQKHVLLHRLAELPMPVLTLWGLHDRIIPFWHAIAADRRLRNGQMRILPFSGHLLPSESEDLFLRHLRRFLVRVEELEEASR
ncbi:alpha/beta fold hydrolase [Streptomyces sp. NPDC051577]|uniref:alpha/beta fold hydrolase n=1 Tax=Streptomyces sp. NPDC051577 TaxID=3155166 RepID=UPI00342D2D1A